MKTESLIKKYSEKLFRVRLAEAPTLRANRLFLLLPLLTPLCAYTLLIEDLYEYQLFYLVPAVLFASVLSSTIIFWKGTSKRSLGLIDTMVVLIYLASIVSGLANSTNLLNDSSFKLISSIIVLYFIVKISLLRNGSLDGSLMRSICWAMLSVASVEALIGILQNYSIDLIRSSGYFKVVGTFYNPNQYAAFVSPSVPIGLGLYLSEEKPFLRKMALIMTLSIVFILPVTLTRSSWLGVIIGAGALASLKYRNKLTEHFRARRLWLLAISLSLIILSAVVALVLYNFRPSSANARILIWRVSTQMIMDRPLLGVGFGNYGAHYMGYQAKFFASPDHVRDFASVAGNVKYADNDFVQITVELGIIGMAVFLALLLLTYASSYKILQQGGLSKISEGHLIGVVGGLTAFLIISFFSFPLHIAPTAVLFSYSLAIISSLVDSGKYIGKEKSASLWIGRFVSIGLVAVMFLVSWHIPERITSYKTWDEAFMVSLEGDYHHAISLYKSVYSALKDDGKFHFMLGGTCVAAGMYREGISELEKSKSNYNDPEIYVALGTAYEKLGDSSNAITNYREASYMMPHWMYPHYLLAKMYYYVRNMAQSKREAETVVNMPVKVESQAVAEMRGEMSDLEKKIELLKQ